MYRVYTKRDLQLDINLVTSEFPVVLADALDRILTAPEVLQPSSAEDVQYIAANL